MAKSKDNCGSLFISTLTVTFLVAVIIISSAAVSEADSLASHSKSSRHERSPQLDEHLRDYMDRMTRRHPVSPELSRGRPTVRHIPKPPRKPSHPHPVGDIRGPSCTCDEGRLTRMDEQIANLLEKTEELTSQTAESRNNIASLMANNRQLRSQMSRIEREKERQEQEIYNLQCSASSLTQNNEQLRAENERLVAELLQAAAVDDNGESADEVVGTLGSSLRELNDLVGNREAELVERGIPVSVGRPQQREPEGRRPESRLDPNAENFASSLLVVNSEIKDMTRKVELLERRVAEQQREVPQDETARPVFRQVPPHQRESDPVSEKIAQLERLVLVALGSHPRDAASERLASRREGVPHQTSLLTAGGRETSRLEAPAAAREQRPSFKVGDEVEPPRVERLALADTMSDEDLDAMANVVESVQNKSPRKCAFSVASTGVTLGNDDNPSTIEFDHVFVNKGSDFKVNQNRFVCEHAGFYFITFTVRSYDGKYLGVTLMKNDELQTAIYSDASDRNVMQSQSVVVHLESGDRLWLRLAPSGRHAVHSGTQRYVTFSGFLVYKGF